MAAHNKLEVIKVYSDQLKHGMYVSELDRPWLETPFLMQGFLITSDSDIEQLQGICEYVFVDVIKSEPGSASVSHALTTSRRGRAEYSNTLTAERELPEAYRHYQSALSGVDAMLKTIAESQSFNSKPIRQHVKSCAGSIIRNPSALMWLSRIKHADSYTAEHSLNVGVLAMSLGRHLGYERADLEALGLCGVLHDVGKMFLDPEILNKPGKLTAEELSHIRRHPVHSRDILLQDESLKPIVLEAAYSHHERMDGLGYPHGVNANQLNEFTKIITIVDAFDAITSERCYSTAKPVSEALKILYENRNAQFDDELVVKFIESIGVYPPGTIVEMSNGEVGFVLNCTQHRLLPRVAIILNKNKQPRMQHVIDLNELFKSQTANRLHIKNALPDGSYGLTLEDYTQRNINLQP